MQPTTNAADAKPLVLRPGRAARRRERRRECRVATREVRERVAYQRLRRQVLRLIDRDEVEALAREVGFTQREAKQIPAFEFVLCCVLATMVEGKRGFAGVWRVLTAAAGIEVARSAVTQRFGPGSAKLMEKLWERVVARASTPVHPELLSKLEKFNAVLADDGSVLALSPVLEAIFPGTRTNHTPAAAKLHARADVVHRRIVRVEITGETGSERAVARSFGYEAGTLYMGDLGYNCYDDFATIKNAGADLLFRLKDDANPTVVRVRHGVRAPRQAEGKKLNDLDYTKSHETFDLDAEFKTKEHGSIVLRVVGRWNDDTQKYHCYVTSVSAEVLGVEEVATTYCLRWVIELLFKQLKSNCHLDHLDTCKPDALRTFIFASLMGNAILNAVAVAAADHAGLHPSEISQLSVGNAAPLLAMMLLLLCLEVELTHEELADRLLNTVAIGCRSQNRGRTRRKWGALN